MGDRGCLSLFGEKPDTHRLLADHLTAEFRVRTEGRGRQVDEWKPRPDHPDNHWLDCLVGNAAAASWLGAALGGPVWLVHRWSVQAMPREHRIEAPATEVAKRRPKMMVLSIGESRMGSQKSPDEQPVHVVKISKRFALSETEVTQGQYQAVMGENLSHFKDWPDWEMLPVEQVSWLDAVKYCNKLSASEGLSPCYVLLQEDEVKWEKLECQGYRLPTEAEWEYAARADETTEYAGSDRLDEVAWHDGNSGSKTHPVGTKKANAWFLKDLSGNIYEWVWDWYADSYKAAGGRIL
jgi:formylglycine-generating enzyme required for sulfatase activity